MSLIIKREAYETFAVLDVRGKVDPQHIAELEAAIKGALTGRQHSLVFNLAGLEFIISSGMGLMLVARNIAEEKGGTVMMAGVKPDVYRVFDLLDFPSFFDFHPTADAAIASLLSAAK